MSDTWRGNGIGEPGGISNRKLDSVEKLDKKSSPCSVPGVWRRQHVDTTHTHTQVKYTKEGLRPTRSGIHLTHAQTFIHGSEERLMNAELPLPLRSPHSPCAINLKDRWREQSAGWSGNRGGEIGENLGGRKHFGDCFGGTCITEPHCRLNRCAHLHLRVVQMCHISYSACLSLGFDPSLSAEPSLCVAYVMKETSDFKGSSCSKWHSFYSSRFVLKLFIFKFRVDLRFEVNVF